MTEIMKRLLTAKQVRERFGGISDMSLWRWLDNEFIGFPAPIYISRRRFWREADIDAFEARHAATSAAPAPAATAA